MMSRSLPSCFLLLILPALLTIFCLSNSVQGSTQCFVCSWSPANTGDRPGRADVCTNGNFNESARTHTCETPGCETVAVYDKNGKLDLFYRNCVDKTRAVTNSCHNETSRAVTKEICTCSGNYCNSGPAEYQYVIQTSIASNVPKTSSAVCGTLSVSVKGANSGLLGRGQSTTFEQGQKQNFFMISSMDFGKVSSLTLTWTPSLYCFVQDCTLYVANVTISSLNRYPESGRLAYTFNGCPASASSKYIAIPPKSTAVFIARSGSLSCK